jgi:hypothetical protein
MGCVEGSGVPVLYIGRRIPKGSDDRSDDNYYYYYYYSDITVLGGP